MKALLLLDFEIFIKKKQYIFPIAYLIFSIAYVLYMMKVQHSRDRFYIIFFTIHLINAFARREHSMKGTIRLFPIRAKTRVNTLFIEIVILNIIVLFGLLISYFPIQETGTILVLLYILVLIEVLVIPAILPINMWHREYFNHLYILLVVVVVSVLVYLKTEINPFVQFLGFASVLYTLAYISSVRILTNKDW